MTRALYSAASGMKAQETNIDNIANNLANANTVGYKMRRAQFQDLMYQSVLQPGTASGQQTIVPAGLQLGLGTRATSNEIIFSQGAFTQTSNPLDLVIQGNGFFQVQQPTGNLAYTRAGEFQLDKNGNIVDANGNAIQPQITIPPDAQAITIASDGTVSYTLPNQIAAQQAAAAKSQAAQGTSGNQTGPPSLTGTQGIGTSPIPNGSLSQDFAELRNCEASGDYQTNTGNGYYGAYQFALGTWLGLGETGLPSDASPAVQDAAAYLLYQRDGWHPWPACSAILNL
jgi:flagellar basal-body rod protein FlgG